MQTIIVRDAMQPRALADGDDPRHPGMDRPCGCLRRMPAAVIFTGDGSGAQGRRQPIGMKPDQVVALAFSARRSEEHTSELQSLMRISYAVFCLKKKKKNIK